MVFKSLVSFKVYLYNSVRNASLDYLKHKNIEGSYLQKMLDAHPVYRTGEEDEEGFFSEESTASFLKRSTLCRNVAGKCS